MTTNAPNPVLVMETSVAPVVAGGQFAGWVSGSPASLALSATATCLFDLGSNWDQYVKLAVCFFPVGPSTGFSNVTLVGSNTTTANPARLLAGDATTTTAVAFSGASLTTVAGAVTATVRPMGRYVIASVTNADGANALGATAKVTLTAYPA